MERLTEIVICDNIQDNHNKLNEITEIRKCFYGCAYLPEKESTKVHSLIEFLKAKYFISLDAETIISNILKNVNNRLEDKILAQQIAYICSLSQQTEEAKRDLERQKRVLRIVQKCSNTFGLPEEQLTR